MARDSSFNLLKLKDFFHNDAWEGDKEVAP